MYCVAVAVVAAAAAVVLNNICCEFWRDRLIAIIQSASLV